jgi:hypothetical protein
MADTSLTKANRSATTEQYVTIWNSNAYGVTLGDLRKLVLKAEGVPDDAEVTVEEVFPHYSRIDVKLAKRISVVHRAGVTDEP